MGKINILQEIENGSLIVKDLDELDKSEYCVLPIMDLSSFGNEIANHLKDIGLDVLNDVLNGQTKQKHGLLNSLKKNTQSHFGVQIKTKKSKTNISKVQDIKSMELSEFAMFSAILVVINSKLTEIIAREKSIVEFLEVNKQSELKGNFLTLNTIVKEYHHNFNNEKFLQNREMQVLDIRRHAEQSILFYKQMAEKKVNSFKKEIHIEIDKALNEIQSRIQYYRLALYIYAYSSFLDVVLLENYSNSFINSVIEDITNHSSQYVEFYSNTAPVVKQMAEKSGKSKAITGASLITSTIGKLFNKMKADKQATKLESSSKSLKEKRDNSVNDLVVKFSNNKDAGVEDIIDNLRYLKNINNNEAEIIIDADNIYIKKD